MATAGHGYAARSHGLALYGLGDLKYAEGQPFDFVNVDAPRNGTLNIYNVGAFTKLNPFSLKGVAAPWIGLCFQSLADGSLDPDEPFSMYGALAQAMEIAEDQSSIDFWLHPAARFSDGRPVTADDVVFSFNIIQHPDFSPFRRMQLKDVESAEKRDDRTVRFRFRDYNRELPLILAGLTILPKHIYGVEGKQFGTDFDEALPVGSGPYIIEDFDKGSYVTYRRNPDWWGRDLPRNRGMFNFERIKIHIFLDDLPARQALKSGTVDAAAIFSSKDWQHEFNGPYFDRGYIRKQEFVTNRVEGMQCFIFNQRRPKFRDIRVRKAIACVFDFEHQNRNLFYNQYTRMTNYWDNHPEMMSRGPAEGPVRDILIDLFKRHNRPDAVAVPKDAILRGPYVVGSTPSGAMVPIEERVIATRHYLDAIGWVYDPAVDARRKGDQILTVEFLLHGPGFQRICNPFIERLREVGIPARIQITQSAEFAKRVKNFDFDIVTSNRGGQESPGNEQRYYFHSSSADTPGSGNLMGLRNPAVDEAVDGIIAADSREQLVIWTQILDRVLCANHYAIPQWYIPTDRGVYWPRIAGPKHYSGKTWFIPNVLYFWWFDSRKAQRLEEAMNADLPYRPAPR